MRLSDWHARQNPIKRNILLVRDIGNGSITLYCEALIDLWSLIFLKAPNIPNTTSTTLMPTKPINRYWACVSAPISLDNNERLLILFSVSPIIGKDSDKSSGMCLVKITSDDNANFSNALESACVSTILDKARNDITRAVILRANAIPPIFIDYILFNFAHMARVCNA